jgi:hypothetical protein
MRPLLLYIALFGVVFFLLGWYEVSMWQECRATPHSFWYCLRVMGEHG